MDRGTLIRTYLFCYLAPGTPDGMPNKAGIEAVMPDVKRQVGILDKAYLYLGLAYQEQGHLGPVAYARHMHELDTEERDAKAIRRRAQLRIVAGTAFDE